MSWAEHTNFHARTQRPYRIILRRDFTSLHTHTLTLIQHSFVMPSFSEITKEGMYLKRNTEVRSRNHCYRGGVCYIL